MLPFHLLNRHVNMGKNEIQIPIKFGEQHFTVNQKIHGSSTSA